MSKWVKGGLILLRKKNVLGVLAISISGSTFAFDYEEHKIISQKSLISAKENKVLVIDNDGIRDHLNSEYLCKNLLDESPEGCLTLSDFPAIAGDHSASPLLTKWKWLNEGGINSPVIPLFDYLAIGKVMAESTCTSSETTRSRIPKVVEFAQLVHRYPEKS